MTLDRPTPIEVQRLIDEIADGQHRILGSRDFHFVSIQPATPSLTDKPRLYLEGLGIPLNGAVSVDSINGALLLGDASLPSRIACSAHPSTASLYSQRDCALRLSYAIKLGWPVLLTGPPNSGEYA